MEIKKTPYSGVHSLELFPVDQITAFAIVQSKVIMQAETGGLKITIRPGTFVPDIQEEEAEGGTVYRIAHSFNVPFNCLDNDRQLKLYAARDVVAVYINEAGSKVVSGTQQYPLRFSYVPASGNYACTLTGVTTQPEAFL